MATANNTTVAALPGNSSIQRTMVESIVDVIAAGAPIVLLLAAFAMLFPLGRKVDDVRKEFLGSLFVVFTFVTNGQWYCQTDHALGWALHTAGMVFGDYVSGGNCNPAISFLLVLTGQHTYQRFLAQSAASMAGGFVGFLLSEVVSHLTGLPLLGGPSLHPEMPLWAACWDEARASLSILATAVLLPRILPWRWAYLARMAYMAGAVRVNILLYWRSGPAMNPMISTCWAAWRLVRGIEDPAKPFVVPVSTKFILVYWVSNIVGSLFLTPVLYLYEAMVSVCRRMLHRLQRRLPVLFPKEEKKVE